MFLRAAVLSLLDRHGDYEKQSFEDLRLRDRKSERSVGVPLILAGPFWLVEHRSPFPSIESRSIYKALRGRNGYEVSVNIESPVLITTNNSPNAGGLYRSTFRRQFRIFRLDISRSREYSLQT